MFAALMALLFLIVIASISYLAHRKRKLTSEKMEGLEVYYPYGFPYKELYKETKGFEHKLGRGGFGVLQRCAAMEVAL